MLFCVDGDRHLAVTLSLSGFHQSKTHCSLNLFHFNPNAQRRCVYNSTPRPRHL